MTYRLIAIKPAIPNTAELCRAVAIKAQATKIHAISLTLWTFPGRGGGSANLTFTSTSCLRGWSFIRRRRGLRLLLLHFE